MANFGDETIGAGDTSVENAVRAIPATMPETGDISSISAAIGETTTANAHTCKGVLYDSSGNVLGETNTRNDIGTGHASSYTQFTFSSPINVVGATPLFLGIAVGGGAGAIGAAMDVGSSGDGRNGTIAAFPTIDDPTTLNSDANQYSIYATYTATGGIEGPMVGGKLTGGGLLMRGSIV